MHREGRRRVPDKQFVEVERVVEIILGRRRESAFCIGPGQRHCHAGAWPHIKKAVDVARFERALGKTPGNGGNRKRKADHGCRRAARAAAYPFAVVSNRLSCREFRRHEFL